MLWLAAIVVLVVVAMLVVERSSSSRGGDGAAVVGVDDGAVRCDDGTAVDWEAVYEVAVRTRRLTRHRTAVSFEVRAAGAPSPVLFAGPDMAEPFIAAVHRLPGFDHDRLRHALADRSRRVVVFSR